MHVQIKFNLLWFSYVLLDLLLPRDEWMCGLLPAHVCRLPFWSYAKLLFNCWLVLPKFNGAAHVYGHFVRPMIEQNGSKAFENLVNKILLVNFTILTLGTSLFVTVMLPRRLMIVQCNLCYADYKVSVIKQCLALDCISIKDCISE